MWHCVASENISEKYVVHLQVVGLETFYKSGVTKRPLYAVVSKIFSFGSYTFLPLFIELFETFLQKPHSISCRTVFETT
jgi:hypothetical protein